MAGDWLKFDKSTPDKPEVWDIAERLDIDPDAVVGKLLRVWSWFDEQSEDGNAPSVSKMLLDRKVGVTGFCNAMVSCGWMSEVANQVLLPNFDRHNGKTAKNRALTAKRVVKHKQKSNAEGNDSLTLGALPREENRREENNIHTSEDASSQAAPDPIPHKEIIDLYHRCFPVGQKVLPSRYKGSTREKQLIQRWRESPKHQTLDFWEQYFTAASQIAWMTGSNNRNWVADFAYLTKRAGFDKTLEQVVGDG